MLVEGVAVRRQPGIGSGHLPYLPLYLRRFIIFSHALAWILPTSNGRTEVRCERFYDHGQDKVSPNSYEESSLSQENGQPFCCAIGRSLLFVGMLRGDSGLVDSVFTDLSLTLPISPSVGWAFAFFLAFGATVSTHLAA